MGAKPGSLAANGNGLHSNPAHEKAAEENREGECDVGSRTNQVSVRAERTGLLNFDVAATDASGRPYSRGYEAREEYEGVLIGYISGQSSLDEDIRWVEKLCPTRPRIADLAHATKRAAQTLKLNPKRLIIEIHQPAEIGLSGYEGLSWTSSDRQILIEFETAQGDNWASHAKRIAWHQLMHSKDVFDGRWPAFHFSSFGNDDKAVDVLSAINNIWIEGYLCTHRLRTVRTKYEAMVELFDALADSGVRDAINQKLMSAIPCAGNVPARSFNSIQREAMAEFDNENLQRAEALTTAWGGGDRWIVIMSFALGSALGVSLPPDCAFSKWLAAARFKRDGSRMSIPQEMSTPNPKAKAAFLQ